jgi:hypothetical protein
MSQTSDLLDFYLIFKSSDAFADLDEAVLLSFLQLCRRIDYPGSSMILTKGSDIRYIYAFLEGVPATVKASGCKPVFWGLEALIAPHSASSDLAAAPEGTRAVVFSVPKLIAFLNEAPDVLIGLLKQTTNA